MKLQLHLGNTVIGDHSLKSLNLMLVFQVNCPGCLSRALPELNQLSLQFPEVNAFAMSTAFEDFNLNTEVNTRALVGCGELTLSSKRYFSRLGCNSLPYQIEVPVVMDAFLAEDKLSRLKDGVLSQVDSDSLSAAAKGRLCDILDQRFVPLVRTGRTFINNDLQGTPSWFIFDDQLNVLDSWFGHKEEKWVQSVIKSHLAD